MELKYHQALDSHSQNPTKSPYIHSLMLAWFAFSPADLFQAYTHSSSIQLTYSEQPRSACRSSMNLLQIGSLNIGWKLYGYAYMLMFLHS